MDSVIFTTDDFQLPCPECEGTGKVYNNEANTGCIKCGGKGVILTGLGQTLLHFIKSHL